MTLSTVSNPLRRVLPVLLLALEGVACMADEGEEPDASQQAASLTAQGLRAEYFDAADLTRSRLVRVDSTINFNWGTGQPAPGIAADSFSVRWTGTLTPKASGTFRLYTVADDGVRLWVGGKLVIDDWNQHGATERSGTVSLTAGAPVDIKLEYFDAARSASVRFEWSGPGTARAVVPASALAPPGSVAPPTSPASARLAWAPPRLTSPTTVHVSNADAVLGLDPTKDYVVEVDEVITAASGIQIIGGHNVVLVGGAVRIPAGTLRRAMYLKHWTGTMHVEGVHLAGSLNEGIDIDTRTKGAVLQLENIRVEKVVGTRDGHHADVLQNWGGPTTFRIDRLTGITTYQGFMMQPAQFGERTVLADFRHVNLRHDGGGGYLVFRAGGTDSLVLTDFWAKPTQPNREGYPESDPVFDRVKIGDPPGGDFAPASRVGMSYVSPGYDD